jgi:ATP-dependent RNA helicase DeaD
VKVERSRHVVFVTPPAVERAGEVWPLVGPNTLVVCADHEQAAQWAAAAPPQHRAHAVTGLGRSAALLKEGRVGLLAGAAPDLAALVARTALKLDAIETIVLAWPETFSDSLDTLLAEAPEARRIVLSWNPTVLGDFLERHARRAEMVGPLPLDADGKPLAPVCSARFAVIPAARRTAAVREVLDALRATRPYVWNGGPVTAADGGADAVICAALPTREELSALAGIGKPVVLVAASQLPYLRSLAALTPLTLAPAADRAQDRVGSLRARIAERLEGGDVDAELALLEPLFERWDPAEVAGALLALQREPSARSTEQEPPSSSPPSGWLRLFVTVGKKDGAGPKDLVGALIKEVGLEKGQLGRIEVRETFSLVEVAPAVAEQAARRLTNVSIRGRRVSARLDRNA